MMNIKSIALAFIALLFCVNLRSIPERRISLKTSQDLNGKIEFDLGSDNFPRLLARTNSSNVTTIYDHQGINEDLDGLITSAQGLVNVVSTATQEDFAVFDYNTYPLTHFKDPDAGYNAAFESMKNIVENQNNAPFYLLIGREIDRIDHITNFRVALSLPSVDSFANITPSISYGLAELVADSINNYSANSILNQGTSSLSDVEAVGIEYLIDLLGNINSVIGNITEGYLTLSGFTKLPPQSTPEDLGIDTTFITTSGKVVNYAGLRYAQGDFGAEVLDGLNDMESYYSSFNISATAIITNNEVTEQEWLASETIYSGDGHTFYYWYHFYESDDGVPTLWIKSKNNLSPSSAENILAFEYQQFLLELNSSPVLNLDGSNNREISNCETECPPLSLTNFKSWTAKKYILSSTCRDAGCSSTLINFLVNDFQLGDGFQSEYHLGLTFGMFDGVLGTISFLSSVSEAFEFISAYTPSNPLGIKTILFRTVRKAAIEKGWKVWEWDIAGSFGSAYGDYWSESMSFWKKAFETLSILTNEEKRKTAISQIGNMIKQYFSDFVNVDDPLIMGHAHGVLVFEVLVEVLSGGGAIIKDIGKAGNRVKKLVSSFANGNQISIGGALLTLRSGANNLQNLWCKTLLNACFVAGTLVSTDVGAVPIENIQVGELIYSSTWVNERAVEDEYLDDLVSVDQLRVDQTSLTNTKWFEIGLKGISKNALGSEIILLRPDWWIKENGIDALQSVVKLSMPEMGVEGHFLLIDKSLVSIPKSEIDKENGLSLSLVSGFFKKRAEVIHQLVFDYNDTLGVTPEHPFYSLSFSDWRSASDLSIGEKVLDREGEAELTSRLIIDKKQTVYNLEVRNQHNYLVGNNGIVVHNTYVTPDELRDLVQRMKAPGSNPRLGGGRDQLLKALKELDLDGLFLTPKLDQFIDDFTGTGPNNTIDLSIFGTDGRMVKAWEMFASSSDDAIKALRAQVPDLEIVSSYLSRYPDNYNLIKNGLENAANKRGYLDWVKHVDTDFEQYHLVFRDWQFGTNKLSWSEYLNNLKNSPTFGPFDYDEAIADLLTQTPFAALSKSEAYSIFGHTTIFSYRKVNRWLREGTNVAQVTPIKDLLNSALEKMPRVPATTNYYRGLPLTGADLSAFVARHQEGSTVTYSEFISAANNRADSFIDDADATVKITMETKANSKGRTIHSLSFGNFRLGTTDEALFSTGSKFEVLSLQGPNNGVYEIVMKEIN